MPGAGAAHREYRRLAQPYCTLRGERSACELPGARKVSLAIQEAVNTPPNDHPYALPEGLVASVFVHNLAQLNAHDHTHLRTHSNPRGSLGHAGCSVDQRTQLSDYVKTASVAPISIDCKDPFYGQFNVTCLNFVKAQRLNEDCQLRESGFVSSLIPITQSNHLITDCLFS